MCCERLRKTFSKETCEEIMAFFSCSTFHEASRSHGLLFTQNKDVMYRALKIIKTTL